MTSLYIVSFLVALIGNSLGIYIIWRRCGIRAATHLLIANLACSNLLIALVVMPTTVAFLYKEHRWMDGIAGTVTCKLTQYLFVLPIASSIFSILVVSVDRFFAVFYPLNGQLFRRPKVMTATIWVCSAILMSPSLATFQVKPRPDGNWHCMFGFGDDPQMAEMLPKVYYSFLFAVLYLLPLVIIAVLYTLVIYKLHHRKIPGQSSAMEHAMAVEKSKRKVFKVLVMIVTAFALCWLPAHAIHYLIFFHSDLYVRMPSYIPHLPLWISHTNSAIDPFLYILLSQNFRREFRQILTQCGFYQKKKRFEMRLSRLTSNFSIRNWDIRRQSHPRSGSSFWSARQPARALEEARGLNDDNENDVHMLNCLPAEHERVKQHSDDHAL